MQNDWGKLSLPVDCYKAGNVAIMRKNKSPKKFGLLDKYGNNFFSLT
jgi:hypothetical protein